jgi:hypothetical protein
MAVGDNVACTDGEVGGGAPVAVGAAREGAFIGAAAADEIGDVEGVFTPVVAAMAFGGAETSAVVDGAAAIATPVVALAMVAPAVAALAVAAVGVSVALVEGSDEALVPAPGWRATWAPPLNAAPDQVASSGPSPLAVEA